LPGYLIGIIVRFEALLLRQAGYDRPNDIVHGLH
jgi:hypothetical protein